MGRYLHLFETEGEYGAARESDYEEPWVSYTEENTEVIYNKTEEEKEKEKELQTPLTFEILTDGNIVWKTNNTASTKTIEYKKNNGEWTSVTSTTGGTSISVVSSDIIQFRGDNNTYDTGSYYNTFSGSTAQFKIKGNIMSLINSTNFSTMNTLENNSTFAYLFNGCTSLTDASELLLPATTLASFCYHYMFRDCSKLTTAPALPATTLANYCYNQMFQGCTSLTTAPELPATTLASYCYQRMFDGCTGLTTAPALPATTLADSCYNQMFQGCTSLTTAPELPATTLASYCYSSMFQGCTSLTATPELPATRLADYCYNGMFSGCTSLTTTPELPATTLVNDCYAFMFNGCTSLTTAPELPATTLASYCYQYMFNGCASLTTAPELQATTLVNSCYAYMFAGCTSLTQAPELPATTLAYGCYGGMFAGCTNLNYIKCLATDISASYCTSNWVSGVTATGTFVAANKATSWKRGNNGIPTGWNVQYVDERINIVPLTFEMQSSGIIRWKASNTTYTATLQYSKNGGRWTTLKSTTGGATISVVSGDTVQFRGDNATMCDESFRYNSFSGTTGQFTLKGNIMSLINSTGFSELSTLTSASTFYSLFTDCTGLTDASELLLPATTLAEYCYAYMFRRCNSLTIAPELPATTLANYCYNNMFFYCTNLNYIKCLATDISASNCTTNWVKSVASTGTFVKNPNMSSWTTGSNGIPTNWTTQDAA